MTTTTEIVAGTVSIEVGNRQHLHRARLLLTINDAPDVERSPITFKAVEVAPTRVNLIAAGFVVGVAPRRSAKRASRTTAQYSADRSRGRPGRRGLTHRTHHDQHRSYGWYLRHRRRAAARLGMNPRRTRFLPTALWLLVGCKVLIFPCAKFNTSQLSVKNTILHLA